MKAAELKAMSFDNLLGLRDQIDAVIVSRVESERRELELKLAKLNRLAGGVGNRPEIEVAAGKTLKGSKVPPRFRNPDNPSETWSGRGLRPRWMVAALAAGRNFEEMLIQENEVCAMDLPPASRKSKHKRAR